MVLHRDEGRKIFLNGVAFCLVIMLALPMSDVYDSDLLCMRWTNICEK
jgi:hypothetical protein